MNAPALADLVLHDLTEFEQNTRLVLNQKLDIRDYVPLRTRNGVYATRLPGLYMIRIKVPAGVMQAAQLRTVAVVLDDYSGSRRAHVTTRQDMQLYHLKLEFTPEILRRLAQAGLMTRQAGGNAVRNIKCCPFAGLHPTAHFDPTPYAQALADYLLRDTTEFETAPGVVRSFANLPRKFKISFGGCCADEDCGQANVNDLGFLASIQRSADGTTTNGFAIKAGGGLSSSPREGLLLKDFIPSTN
jgi:sulfite reductase (ferredoxin)